MFSSHMVVVLVVIMMVMMGEMMWSWKLANVHDDFCDDGNCFWKERPNRRRDQTEGKTKQLPSLAISTDDVFRRGANLATENDSKECSDISFTNVGLSSLDLRREQHQHQHQHQNAHHHEEQNFSSPLLGYARVPINAPTGGIGTHNHTLAQPRQAKNLLLIQNVENSIGVLLDLHEDVLALVRELQPWGVGESIKRIVVAICRRAPFL